MTSFRCARCKMKPRLDYHRYCRACHASYQRRWRAERARELIWLRRMARKWRAYGSAAGKVGRERGQLREAA